MPLTQVVHAGIKQLPGQPLAELAPWVPADVVAQAQASGYGNAFQAVPAELTWKTPLLAEDGHSLHPPPRPGGPLTATVVGPDGDASGQGAQEIHTDRLGRIRIRFDFQRPEAGADTPETSQASTWVRVLHRQAGPGMGWHFIPRLGQEVLVDFMDGRVDRPIVIAALYNGQGEAGVQPTPGGADPAANDTDTDTLAHSSPTRLSIDAREGVADDLSQTSTLRTVSAPVMGEPNVQQLRDFLIELPMSQATVQFLTAQVSLRKRSARRSCRSTSA